MVAYIYERDIALDDVSTGASCLLILASCGKLKRLATSLPFGMAICKQFIIVSKLHARQCNISRGPVLAASYQTPVMIDVR